MEHLETGSVQGDPEDGAIAVCATNPSCSVQEAVSSQKKTVGSCSFDVRSMSMKPTEAMQHMKIGPIRPQFKDRSKALSATKGSCSIERTLFTGAFALKAILANFRVVGTL